MTNNKIAVVAGAGSGIGQCCAQKLASAGYDLILVGRTKQKLDTTADSLKKYVCKIQVFPADVRDWDEMDRLGALLSETGIDLLINSAGGQFSQPSAELSKNGWQSVVDNNLSGSFFLCRHLYPALKKRQGSVVMVVADIWRKPAPTLAHSGAARAGIVNLTKTLALEWAVDRIRVNAVSPGLTNTDALLAKYTNLVANVPLGRIGETGEMADAILFLAHSSYITGEILTIDGGLNLV